MDFVKRVITTPGYTDFAAYAEPLRAAGVQLVEGDALEGFDGLLLMGGTDVNPALYRETPGPQTQEPDEVRDQLETILLANALGRDMPVLAICRGMQMLNVQHGGSLIQHLGGHVFKTPDRGQPAHPVDIVPGTRLALIAGAKLRWQVNSRHHQAVGRVGQGLTVSATDPRDGTVEAIERPDKRFVVAVQWHPENQPDMARLFCGFAASL